MKPYYKKHTCSECQIIIYDEATKESKADGSIDGDESICVTCEGESDGPTDDGLDYIFGADGWRNH